MGLPNPRAFLSQGKELSCPSSPLNKISSGNSPQSAPLTCQALTCIHRWGEQFPQCLQAWCEETLWGSWPAHHLKDNLAVPSRKHTHVSDRCGACSHTGSSPPPRAGMTGQSLIFIQNDAKVLSSYDPHNKSVDLAEMRIYPRTG